MSKEEKIILTGNEAIARGAYEAGVRFASAYPGTPSTEILENISKYREIYSQWSVNEKVALEAASGASIAGARALAAMKHVGLNVAADPFMTLSYTGVTGGLVVVCADDPDMHSSQNEQDNRNYAQIAKAVLLEPSDSQECKDFLIEGFEISEKFDTPVMLRTTTRISHSRSAVVQKDRTEKKENFKYKKNALKYVMIPAYARTRHKAVISRLELLEQYSETTDLNKIINDGSSGIGIITSGVSFNYAMEAFKSVPVLKLGMTFPFPSEKVKNFCKNKYLIIVIEELDPFLQEKVELLRTGAVVIGKEFFPHYGELSYLECSKLESLLAKNGFYDLEINDLKTKERKDGSQSLKKTIIEHIIKDKSKERSCVDGSVLSDSFKIEEYKKLCEEIPQRPPVLCAGCSHRPVFHILKKLRTIVMGDIGCYTLAVLPPLNAIDSCLCMGAGVSQMLGAEKAAPELKGRLVSVIGDSTFFHSGITSLIDNVFNKSTGLVLILDNSITAMTGHQTHPGVGRTLMGEPTYAIKPEDIAKAAGVRNIKIVDPYDLEELEKEIKEELARDELSVIICRRPCVLTCRDKDEQPFYIDEATCKKCGLCIKFGCPAIERREDVFLIDEAQCSGCGACVSICPSKSILKREKN